MASAGLYLNARSLFLRGGLNWLADTPSWRLLLLTADYVVDLGNHSTLDDIQPQQAISTAGDILGRNVQDGYARADMVRTIGGNIGQEVTQAVIVCGGALVWHSDASPDFPYIADGGEAYAVWDVLARGPFRL